MDIIIGGRNKIGTSRSEMEENLRKEGRSTGMTDEQLHKCKFLERKVRDYNGLKETFIDNQSIDNMK